MRGGCTPGGIETITGLSIGDGRTTPQKVYLEVYPDKYCYVVLPSGEVLTYATGVINHDWRGNAGRVKLIVPKITSILRISSGKFIGTLLSNGTYNTAFTYQDTSNGIESISLPNASYIVNVQNDNSLKDVYCPKATRLFAAGSSLTAKSIGDFLFAAVANNPTASGVANFTGGNNATDRAITDYMKDTYNPFVGPAYEYASIDELLVTWINLNLNQWAISLNGGY